MPLKQYGHLSVVIETALRCFGADDGFDRRDIDAERFGGCADVGFGEVFAVAVIGREHAPSPITDHAIDNEVVRALVFLDRSERGLAEVAIDGELCAVLIERGLQVLYQLIFLAVLNEHGGSLVCWSIPKRDAGDGFLADGWDAFGHVDARAFGQHTGCLRQVWVECENRLSRVAAPASVEHAVEGFAGLADQRGQIALHISSTVVRGLPCKSRTAQWPSRMSCWARLLSSSARRMPSAVLSKLAMRSVRLAAV